MPCEWGAMSGVPEKREEEDIGSPRARVTGLQVLSHGKWVQETVLRFFARG